MTPEDVALEKPLLWNRMPLHDQEKDKIKRIYESRMTLLKNECAWLT